VGNHENSEEKTTAGKSATPALPGKIRLPQTNWDCGDVLMAPLPLAPNAATGTSLSVPPL
jgi:hypothetical protein